MWTKIKDLYNKYGDVLRYLIIGGVTTLIDFLTFTLLNGPLGVHYQVANIVAWVVAVCFAFVGNKWVVFRTETPGWHTLAREAGSFVAMRLTTLLFSAVFLYVTVSLLAWDETLSKLISNIVVIILNYVLSKLVVFRKKA